MTGEVAIPVLFVAGTGRSGSTVMANVLGEIPGCVSVGELRYVWQRGLRENRLCGCGSAFADCPFWSAVLATAFPEGPPDPELLLPLLAGATRLRALPKILLQRRRVPTGSLDELAKALEPVYAAVIAVSGARVVVDSSKLPSYAALLNRLAGLQVTAVHLVRDPRAAAFSWRRTKVQPDRRVPGIMEQRGALKSVALWVVWNGALELLWRGRRDTYLRVRYESFVVDPKAVVDDVADRLGLTYEPAELFPEAGTVRLGLSHTVAGNPARLTRGNVRLRLDDEWLAAMPAGDRLLATLGAVPLLHRYGYPLRVGRRRPRSQRR